MHKKYNDDSMYELIAEWLREYHVATDVKEQAKYKALIVSRMLPIVKRIARLVGRRAYDPVDDLIQAGCIGLLKAIDSFSFEINDQFKYYAGSLIIGEIKHYIRDKLNLLKVPRHVQELSFRINSFVSKLTTEEFNELTNEYVAEALNVDTQDVDRALMSERRKNVVSLDFLYNNDEKRNLSYEEMISIEKYEQFARIEDARLILDLVIARLPKEYRRLVSLYYYEDLPQKDIAKLLNLSDMQVSRNLKKAFELLQDMIADSKMGESLMEIFN